MNNKILVIHGIGDGRYFPEKIVRFLWKVLYKSDLEFYAMPWEDDDVLFEFKLNALLRRIDEIANDVGKINLIGISAGGSAAINAFTISKDKIAKLVCLSSRIYGDNFEKGNEAFRRSVELVRERIGTLPKSYRKKIMTIRPVWDGLVPAWSSEIEGAVNKKILSFGHVPGVVMSFTTNSRLIDKFIKEG